MLMFDIDVYEMLDDIVDYVIDVYDAQRVDFSDAC